VQLSTFSDFSDVKLSSRLSHEVFVFIFDCVGR
jgi:hypothetical protein